MPKSYEFHGKSVEQALEKASGELNIPAEKIKHKVLAYGSSGIFGLVGVKKAKIKVFVDVDKVKADTVITEAKNALAPKDTKSPRGDEKTVQPPDDTADRAALDDNIVEAGQHALQKMVDGITVGAAIDTTQKKDKLIFSISGGESGVMIGKRGQTLEAIQYLLEKMINKKSTNRIRVLVDVEGYLEKRSNNLQQMASRLAEKAKTIKKPVTLGQMNAHDRRIVHIHLKDEKGVRTQSVGDGYYRKLMIFPKKQDVSKRRDSENKQ